jgi:hypothetical protein
MRSRGLVALFALAFGAWLGIGAVEKGRIGVDTAEAAGGCGIGFHRALQREPGPAERMVAPAPLLSFAAPRDARRIEGLERRPAGVSPL